MSIVQRQNYLFLLVLAVLPRVLLVLFNGAGLNSEIQPDSVWLQELADDILKGNYLVEKERFVVSPILPYLVAGLKLVFVEYWGSVFLIMQVLVGGATSLYLYKLSLEIHKDARIAFWTLICSASYPFVIWYTNAVSQENLFTFLLVASMYHLFKSCKDFSLKSVVISAVFFALAFLTKSHILLFSLFIPVIYFFILGFTKKSVVFSCTYALICLLFASPYAFLNYQENNGLVISSNGAGYQFYLGNSDAGYLTTVKVPSKEAKAYEQLKDINTTAGFLNGHNELYQQLLVTNQKEKQKAFFSLGLTWCKDNPMKLFKLKLMSIVRFFTPGVRAEFYSTKLWFLSILLCTPVFILGYMYLLVSRADKSYSLIFIFIAAAILLMYVIWYPQNRFRAITLEPFLILNAVSAGFWVFNKIQSKKNND